MNKFFDACEAWGERHARGIAMFGVITGLVGWVILVALTVIVGPKTWFDVSIGHGIFAWTSMTWMPVGIVFLVRNLPPKGIR